MSDSKIAICEIDFYLPGISSLKEKRSIIKSMLAQMRNKFNVANAEVAYQDVWQSAKIAITTVSNSASHAEQRLNAVIDWIEGRYPDAVIVEYDIEVI